MLNVTDRYIGHRACPQYSGAPAASAARRARLLRSTGWRVRSPKFRVCPHIWAPRRLGPLDGASSGPPSQEFGRPNSVSFCVCAHIWSRADYPM